MSLVCSINSDLNILGSIFFQESPNNKCLEYLLNK